MHRHDLGAQQLHAKHIGPLPLDVGVAHIDDAGNVEQRAGGRGGNAMLAGAGLGDDAALAHAPRQQHLPEHVVDLVRAGMVQLVPLKVELGAAEVPGQPLGEVERARPPDIMVKVVAELGVEVRIVLRRVVSRLDLQDQRHQRLGDKAPAVKAEMALRVRPTAIGVRCLHHRSFCAPKMHHRDKKGTKENYFFVSSWRPREMPLLSGTRGFCPGPCRRDGARPRRTHRPRSRRKR